MLRFFTESSKPLLAGFYAGLLVGGFGGGSPESRVSKDKLFAYSFLPPLLATVIHGNNYPWNTKLAASIGYVGGVILAYSTINALAPTPHTDMRLGK